MVKLPAFLLILLSFTIATDLKAELWEQHVTVTLPHEDAFATRQQAFIKARRNAWQQLLSALSANAVTMTDDAVEATIDSISIADEETTETEYKATFNISFAQRAVEKYLQKLNIDYSLPVPVRLIVPIFEKADETLLWDEHNIWRQNLESVKINTFESKNRFILPLGDLVDQKDLSVDNLSQEAVLDMAARYGTTHAVLALLKQEEEQFFLSYILYPEDKTYTITGSDMAVIQQRFLKAIHTVEKKPKKKSRRTISVKILLDTGESWLTQQQLLKNTPNITAIAPSYLSSDQVQAKITFIGKVKELKHQLEYIGYKLEEIALDAENSIWQLVPLTQTQQSPTDIIEDILYNDSDIEPEPLLNNSLKRPLKTYEVISQ